MFKLHLLAGQALMALTLAGFSSESAAAVVVWVDHVPAEEAEAGFVFSRVRRPLKNDAGTTAAWEVLAGRLDPNGGGLACVHDGAVPLEEDAPGANLFFAPGTSAGRLWADLGRALSLQEVNTYSWHPGGRAPQVYQLYGSDGLSPGFQAKPAAGVDLLTAGWTRLGAVDTHDQVRDGSGGQYGASVRGDGGPLGTFRYLLWEVRPTNSRDRFGQTFFSEIDVLEAGGAAPQPVEPVAGASRESIALADGRYELVLDVASTPDLSDWAHREAVPLMRDWYPKLLSLLPSEGFVPPKRVHVRFDPTMKGVADTAGTRIRCAGPWFRDNLRGEARGALFHELVHVVQQYDRARPKAGYQSPPGWLVEGIADYVRWFRFEPESHGAEIRGNAVERARYDASYRVTAHFLDWATRRYQADLVPRLNAAIREGVYREEVWSAVTGKELRALGAEWKAELLEKRGTEQAR